jgi:hypothetical protein
VALTNTTHLSPIDRESPNKTSGELHRVHPQHSTLESKFAASFPGIGGGITISSLFTYAYNQTGNTSDSLFREPLEEGKMPVKRAKLVPFLEIQFKNPVTSGFRRGLLSASSGAMGLDTLNEETRKFGNWA